MSTSALSINASTASTAPGCFRSTSRGGRPRASTSTLVPDVGFCGRSMRMTSAPMSASSMPQNGAGPRPTISTTLRSASGPDIAHPPETKTAPAGAVLSLLDAQKLFFFLVCQQRLHRQTHSALPIDFEHLDLDFLTLAEFVADFFDAIVRNLRNMHQAVATGDEIDERAEVHQTHDFALVDLARFDVAGNVFDAFDGQIGGRLVDGGDIN